MSMNFAREQSLLRQQLTALGSPAAASGLQQATGSDLTFLGAPEAALLAAASKLAADHPQMGRAQMTAFVRTLWRSRIHELRVVGIELLALRAALLEPADLPFVDELLRDCKIDAVAARLAEAVLGSLVGRHKKLWKELKRYAASKDLLLRRAAVRACRLALEADGEAFARFAELGDVLASTAEPELWQTLDQLLLAVADSHAEAVREFAAKHGRQLKLPKAAAAKLPAAPAKAASKALPRPPASKKVAAKAVRPSKKPVAGKARAAKKG